MFAIATYQTIVPLKIRLIGDIIEPRDLGSCSIVPIEDLSSLVSLWDFGYLRLQFLRKHTVQNKNHGFVVQSKNTWLSPPPLKAGIGGKDSFPSVHPICGTGF